MLLHMMRVWSQISCSPIQKFNSALFEGNTNIFGQKHSSGPKTAVVVRVVTKIVEVQQGSNLEKCVKSTS